MANTSWLQRTGKPPRAFKTKGAAVAELKSQQASAVGAGWEKAFGSATKGHVVMRKGERLVALVVSTVDADGLEADTGRVCREEYRGVTAG